MALYAKHESELPPKDRARILEAMRELKEAVAGYDRFVVTTPLGSRDVDEVSFDDLSRAQRRVTEAEAELWRLREELMGWIRPSSQPGAAVVADWFSEEDEVYDKMGEIPPAGS